MTEQYAPHGEGGSRAPRVVLVLPKGRATDAVRRAGLGRKALPLLAIQDPDRAELHFPEPETAALTAALLVLQGRDFEAKEEGASEDGASPGSGTTP